MTNPQLTCRLEPTSLQKEAIDATLVAFREAWTWAAEEGMKAGTSSNVRIHHLVYKSLRSKHGLSANLAIRAVARAARHLKEHPGQTGAESILDIEYDARVFSYCLDSETVSISSVRGRIKDIRLTVTPKQRIRLSTSRPQRVVLYADPSEGYFVQFWMEKDYA